MTQIPLSIEQTVAPQPKRSTATKLVVGLLGVFAVVCVYQQGPALVSSMGWSAAVAPRASTRSAALPNIAAIVGKPAERVPAALMSTARAGKACLLLPRRAAQRSRDAKMAAGLYYSTTTGNTETVAGYIAEETGLDAVDIGDVSGDDIMACDSLIIGAPTWHTGADSERSGTAWDEFLYGDLTGLDLSGKKVAIFGMGDQSGYADNYCDAMDELASCFEKQGATIVGAWSSDGYDHEDSKSIRGDKFVGCAFDEDNQPELSEERAKNWVAQIKGEGITV
jgi:flavodoxin I